MNTRTEIISAELEKPQSVRINIGATANDFGGESVKTKFVQAESLAMAMVELCKFRQSGNYGSQDFRKGCGDVLDMNGKKIAEVSYNGRVWAV